ncbi:hypothetical protein FGIG_11946, partial [Fasciola gigantica]
MASRVIESWMKFSNFKANSQSACFFYLPSCRCRFIKVKGYLW